MKANGDGSLEDASWRGRSRILQQGVDAVLFLLKPKVKSALD
jgi:hypothetical protein